MKKNDVKLVKKGYVSDECVQVMEDYCGPYISIFGSKLLYHLTDEKNDHYNAYLSDLRRFSFPYNNIPSHVESSLLNGKVNYVNQLYDFDKKYVIIKDYYVFGRSQFKLDSGECITISEVLKPKFTGAIPGISYPKVKEIVSRVIPNDVYILSGCGVMRDKEEVSSFIFEDNELSIIYVSTSLVGAKASGLKIYRNDHDFDVLLFDFPFAGFDKDNIEQFKENVTVIKEPKIKRRYNPGVEKSDIICAKTMARYKNM